MNNGSDQNPKQKGGEKNVEPGIGNLVRSNRKARIGRNPATGNVFKKPAKLVVKKWE